MTNNANPSPSSTLTFAHKFSPTVQCSVRVSDQPPEPGAGLNLRFEWSGQPKREHLAPYRQFILSTVQILSDRWGATILYGLGTAADSTEVWVFEPGKAPRLLEKLPVGIP
jgi:hypothetical protein